MDPHTEGQILSAFRHYIQSMVPVSNAAWTILTQAMVIAQVKKDEWLLKEGETCRHIYFVYAGAFRAFFIKDESDITTALYIEGMCMTNMRSLAKKEPSTTFIQALEDAVIIKLSKEQLIALYDQAAELQAIGRVLTEYLVAEETEWREMLTIFTTEERYQFLVKKAPELLQKIPLQYIASYLGMRRETLSRIRGRAARGT